MASIPKTAREYRLPETGTYHNLVIKEKVVETPKALEVLVKVHTVSLQYRDLFISKSNLDFADRFPNNLIPCSDMAGEIVALGEGVKDLKVGDRVCSDFATDHTHGEMTPEIQVTCMGGQSPGVLTEYRTFPAHAMVKLPDYLSYEQASTLPCAAVTAYNALYGATPVKAGDYVLVLGTGGVSIFALQFAATAGAIVIVTSSSDEKLKIATKLGAKHVINYNKVNNWDEEVLRITKGVGVDHVIEVGGDGTLPKSMKAVKMGGFIAIVGFLDTSKPPSKFIYDIIIKAINIRGIQIGSVVMFKNMIRHMEANPKGTLPLIDKIFSFEDVIDGYTYLESQKHVGKIVIKVA